MLKAIESQNVRVIREDGQPSNIRMFDWINMVPSNANQATGTMVASLYQAILNQIDGNRQNFRSQLQQIILSFEIQLEPNFDVWSLCEMTDKDLRKIYGTGDQFETFRDSIRGMSQQLTANVIANIGGNTQQKDCVDHIIQDRKTLATVDQEYVSTLPFFWEHSDLFQHSFAELFLAYFNKQCSNYVKLGMAKEGKAQRFAALTELQFTKQHGQPPWDFVNDSMETAGLDFRIDHPTDAENRTYRPTLTKKSTGDVVEFSALSSGEKILMSFAFCLYHATDKRTSVPRPNLLLFDEIDAPLHPSMCRRLMNIIHETLVVQNGIDVIFVTHSPSTIAVAPEDAIHLLEPGTNKITKETKRQAISALTAEIPTMSISFDSRRQVFVESSLDAKRYEKLYRICSPAIESERSLVFIGVGKKGSKGDEGAGSAKVKSIVRDLEQAGNESVFGLIDWDRSNQETERVKVLAAGSRYAIENCLLDPLFVAAVLMQVDRPAAEHLFGKNYSYVELGTLDVTELQGLSVAVQCKLLKVKNLDKHDVVKCTYLGGAQLNVAKSILEQNGHELENFIKETFPPLKKYKNAGALLDQIIETSVRDHTKFLPLEVKSVFEALSFAT